MSKSYISARGIDTITRSSFIANTNRRQQYAYSQGVTTSLPTTTIMPISQKKSITRKISSYRKIAACRKKVKIIPVGKIHSLDPSMQPRAWLDVMASLWTTRDEKNEAMEEILILSKDKHHARMLLEEGVMDSLLYIIRIYFQSILYKKFNHSPNTGNFTIPPESLMVDPSFIHAKLASNCCIALGKAHCALVHTDGDLVLMSSYNHGTVPITRQLAQMLHEVPYNVPMSTSENDNNITSETFTLKEISLQHAEDLANSIANLAEGRIDEKIFLP